MKSNKNKEFVRVSKHFILGTQLKIKINNDLTWFWDPPSLDLVLLNTGSVPVMTRPNSWGHGENTKTIKNNALSQFLWCLIKKWAVPERPGTRWSTALVWHLQGPSACSKHLDTPTKQWTTQCNQWVVILGPSHTSKQISNQKSPIWNPLALYRPVCLCEWLQWMGFHRNILENIYGLSYFIYLCFKQTGAEYAKESVRGKNNFCAIATRGQTDWAILTLISTGYPLYWPGVIVMLTHRECEHTHLQKDQTKNKK